MTFAYVSFVNNNPMYLGLMKSTIESVQTYSKHNLILYLVNVPPSVVDEYFPNKKQLIIRHITTILTNIFFYKPFVIIDAIKQGLETGYYIESDDVLTPYADRELPQKASMLSIYPICPIHPSNPTPINYMNNLGVLEKTQHYIHGHVLFKASNLDFLEEWYNACYAYNGENSDESALNCMFWRHKLTNHYMDIVDYYYTNFYESVETRNKTYSYHGCKNPLEQAKLLEDMNKFYLHKTKVISFCLWGHEPRYTIGALKNAEIAKDMYPDFMCWFYIHVPSVPKDIIEKLEKYNNVRVILRHDKTIRPNYFMSWRFEPHDDPTVELFMSRDTDTRILRREVLAVREWLETDKMLHIMRDSPCHYPVVLGGMFGLRTVPNFNMTLEIMAYFATHATNDDQSFLKDTVYPLVKHSCVIHDEIKLYEGNLCRKFPIKWDCEYHFVGEYRYEDESQNAYYTNIQRKFLESTLPHRIEKNPFSLKYCLLACDLNKDYLDFYPIVRECWKRFVGIDTRLILIAESIPSYLEAYSTEIILYPPSKDIHPAFQAQCIRILYPALMNTNDCVIISDMDLVPTNKDFYTGSHVSNLSNTDFVIYRNCIEEYKQYPICFCASSPKTWKSIFNVESIQDIRKLIESWYTPDYVISSPTSKGWAMDQTKLFEYVGKWSGNKVLLTDLQTKHKRLDRLSIRHVEANQELYYQFIRNGVYSDFHMPRPYSKYKDLLERILFGKPLFDKIFIIHYTKLAERRKYMEHQLINQFPTQDVEWITNFDREDIKLELLKSSIRYNPKIMSRHITIGEIANGLAHNHVIKTIAELHDVCLVLEDDIVLKPNFLQNLEHCLTLVPSDWEILTLGGHFQGSLAEPVIINDTNDINISELRVIRYPKICTTVCCYLVKKSVASRIIKHCLFYPFSAPIDETLCHILPDIDAKIYWVQPWLAYEGTKSGMYPTSFTERGF